MLSFVLQRQLGREFFQMPSCFGIILCVTHGSAVKASGNCCFDTSVHILYDQAILPIANTSVFSESSKHFQDRAIQRIRQGKHVKLSQEADAVLIALSSFHDLSLQVKIDLRWNQQFPQPIFPRERRRGRQLIPTDGYAMNGFGIQHQRQSPTLIIIACRIAAAALIGKLVAYAIYLHRVSTVGRDQCALALDGGDHDLQALATIHADLGHYPVVRGIIR